MKKLYAEDWAAIIFCVVTFLIVCGAIFGWVFTLAHFEAKAYNRVTGSNVTAWDAIFLEFRVQEGVKE